VVLIWPKKLFQIEIIENVFGTVFLYKFWKSFVFLAHVAKTENDAGKLQKLGETKFFKYWKVIFFGWSDLMLVIQSWTPY
jgi:hypothetical protein